jgi:hypothetical protein
MTPALQSLALLLALVPLAGCGAADRSLPPSAATPSAPSANSVDGTSPPAALPTRTVANPASDEVRLWARATPGHEDAEVTSVEPVATMPDGPVSAGTYFHLVAVDSGTTLDAWVESRSSRDASDYWRMAAAVAAAERGEVDDFVRADGWILWSAHGRTLICEAAGERCFELPTPRRVDSFFCSGRDYPCHLSIENDAGRMEEWEVKFTRRGARRRLERTWAREAAVLDGPTFVDERRERGVAVALLAAPTRPLGVDDVRFRDRETATDAQDDERVQRGGYPCRLQVASLRDGDVVVRVVTCAAPYPDGSSALASFVVERAGHAWATPVFASSLGAPDRLQSSATGTLAADILAPGAVSLVAEQYDGGSPGGHSERARWVIVPATPTRGVRAHRLVVGSTGTIGLGDSGDPDGYVVGLHRMRASVVFGSPLRGHYVSCEHWDGEHARGSDRWTGTHRVETLGLPVSFDVERGFAMSEADRAAFEERCSVSE